MVETGAIGILCIGVVLGWLVLFFLRIHRHPLKISLGGKGFATIIATIAGVGVINLLVHLNLLDPYGIGLLIGLVANIVYRHFFPISPIAISKALM